MQEVGYIKEVKAPQHPGRVNCVEGKGHYIVFIAVQSYFCMPVQRWICMLQEALPVSLSGSLQCSRPNGRPRSEHIQLTSTSSMAKWTCLWTWGAQPSVSLLAWPTCAHVDLYAAGVPLVRKNSCHQGVVSLG